MTKKFPLPLGTIVAHTLEKNHVKTSGNASNKPLQSSLRNTLNNALISPNESGPRARTLNSSTPSRAAAVNLTNGLPTAHLSSKHPSQHASQNTPFANFSSITPPTLSMTSRGVQAKMIERLQQGGIKSLAVLNAMQQVPRHEYLDSGLASHAYSDNALPIGFEQTISQPYIVARMIEILLAYSPLSSPQNSPQSSATKPLGQILEIGTGCGYQAHVLSLLAREVFSIERIKGLYQLARKNVQSFRLPNLRLILGDGYAGLPEVAQTAPFDGIILAAACPAVPEALKQQLKIGACLVAPVGEGQNQWLELWRRKSAQSWHNERLEPCHFVPMLKGIRALKASH